MNLWEWFLFLVPSVILHEVSHGWVANFFGDPTAKQQHRLTLNPLAHVDLFGTIIMPLVLLWSGLPAFGYAKPVPVNIGRLRNPRSQALWVALAGPAVNVVLSALGAGICEYALHVSQSLTTFHFGEYLGLVNLVLAVFNLIPIPPLDGSAVIERFLPRRTLARYYQLRARALPAFFILLIVFFSFSHLGDNWLNDLENWWYNLVIS
jgi:Zn-dependent protease